MAKPWMEVGRYGSVGLELVLTILIPAAFGHWLDGRYWGHAGWGAGVGFVIGTVVGFRNLIRTANGMQRDIERAEAKDPAASRWTVDESWVHKDDDENGKDGPPS
jgi:F0F1-type ATP synthase assembly protein I